MYTLLAVFCFLGVFQQYNTSGKARLLAAGSYQKWLQFNRGKARWTGLLLMLLSLFGLIIADGWMLGLFTFILLLMSAACYTIALAPFGYVKLKHVVIIALVSLLIELIVLNNAGQ